MHYQITLIALLFQLLNLQAQGNKYYNFNTESLSNTSNIDGQFRIIAKNGRAGINTTGIYSRIKLPNHLLNNPQGTFNIWVMTLEDIAPTWSAQHMKTDNPFINIYSLLCDNRNGGNFADANFSFHINKIWHPGLTVKFKKGTGHDMYNHAAAAANHSDFDKLRWYQLSVSWNFLQNNISLFINGIKVGNSDITADTLNRDICGDTLYAGNPSLVISEITFYEKAISNTEIYSLYKNGATDYDKKYEEKLRKIYTGSEKKMIRFVPDKKWTKNLDLTLQKTSDFDSFYVQGFKQAVSITSEGLKMQTPQVPIGAGQYEKQVYIWTLKPFEGDLYVEYEFKTLKRGGLSLLMTQASGMQREDFMADYPLRTAGNMNMVAWSSVRNYHWEYYREMNDVRNDIACGAMLKNPYQYPLGFSCFEEPFKLNTWHKLQFLQRGNHIIGAINGRIVIDAYDNGFTNNGAVYSFGRIAIRCMVRSEMLFRNLKVYNRNENFQIIK